MNRTHYIYNIVALLLLFGAATTTYAQTIRGNIYGGGQLATVDGNTEVEVSTGKVAKDVYGGGALADVEGNTVVNLYGGAIGTAFGGGLGQLADDAAGKVAVEALVKGNATVTLGKVIVDGDGNKSYTASQVTGDGIFGANNQNGTPKGHVLVHVLKTTPRSTNSGENPRNVPGTPDSYDVPSVYGGGNLSAYEPWTEAEITALGTQDRYTYTANEFAEVLIENCYNSIAYVYGGGNAAPVPATNVTVYGADAIDYLFGGGNGSGDGNPGANIGIKTDNTTAYGAGTVNVNIYGGTIHEVFGGSNTKGLIRTSANVNVAGDPDDTDDIFPCDLNVGNVHGGGNKADMLCGGTITLGCTQGVDVVYAGAEAADIHGDINLTIASGTYTKVFGGNNLSGNIYGSIQINIDETGCYPIIIGSLYGGGNLAAYSVYGYNDDGTPKESGENPSADPTINIISCTSIGNIYGGGYGATAKMYGNPWINVNMLKGDFADREMSADSYYILNNSGERELNTEGTIPNAIGTIGYIYGGGEQAAVEGDTHVNICTEETIKHIGSSAEGVTPKANITGDVYGGGKGAFDGGNLIDAYVSGSTNVKIGKDK